MAKDRSKLVRKQIVDKRGKRTTVWVRVGSAPKKDKPKSKFDKWFEGSKAVDSKGKPLVVYHGSQTDITEFHDGGTYFTDDFMNADGYAGGENVYEAYLSIKKPLVIDAKGKKWDEIETPYGTSTQEVVGKLDTKKYDGVIFNNIKDSWIDDVDYLDPSTIYWVAKVSQMRAT